MASSNPQLPRKGDIIASKYQVEGTLGTGGMGAVYKVSHRVTGKNFAVKWLLPQLTSGADAIKRFIREAQVAGRVDHPNVVEVYDVGQDGESFYMVMELLLGEPLSQRMAAAGQMDPAAACRILIPVTRGLAAAHKADVIHRDLKPDNIFLCSTLSGEEQPKVLDFGISKMNPINNEVDASITRDGMVMGTPHYMSPEQVRSQPVDARTDVYALGVILYQMLAGTLPFPGDNFTDLLLKIMTETPRPLDAIASRTPKRLVEIVASAMAREPAQRFASVAEFGRALEPYAEGMFFDVEPLSSPARNSLRSPGPRTPLATESQLPAAVTVAPGARSSLRWIAAGLAAVGVGVGLGLWISQRSHERAEAPAPHVATPKPVAVARPDALAPAAPQAVSDVYVPQRPSDAAASLEDLPTLNTKRLDPEPVVPPALPEAPPSAASVDAPPRAPDPTPVVPRPRSAAPNSVPPRARPDQPVRPRVPAAPPRTPNVGRDHVRLSEGDF